MTALLCCILWLLVALALPVLILDWLTISRTERIQRLRAFGYSQQRIADHLGISRRQVRQALA